MPEDTINIVRRLLEANRSGRPDETVDIALALSTPEMEFTSRITAVEGARYLGHDGVRAYFRDMADAFRDWHNEPDDLVEIDSGVVLADNLFHGVGKDSGMPVTLRSAIVFVFSDDKIARCVSAPSREEALREAGIG